MKEDIPIYQKITLTLEEASALTHIGREKIKELTESGDCNFHLKVGTRTLIKREMFIAYLNKKTVI